MIGYQAALENIAKRYEEESSTLKKEVDITQVYALIKDRGHCTLKYNKEIGGCNKCFMLVKCTDIVDHQRHTSREDFFQMIYNESLAVIKVLIAEGKISESDLFEVLL